MEKEVRYEGESYPYGVLKQPLHSPGEKKGWAPEIPLSKDFGGIHTSSQVCQAEQL